MAKNNNQTPSMKYERSRRKINIGQAAKGLAFGTALLEFGASQKGVFDNFKFADLINGDFLMNNLNKGLEFYGEVMKKFDPKGETAPIIFLSASGALLVLLLRGIWKKRRLNTKTIRNISNDYCDLRNVKTENESLQAQVAALQTENDGLKAKKRTRQPSQPTA